MVFKNNVIIFSPIYAPKHNQSNITMHNTYKDPFFWTILFQINYKFQW